MKNWDDARIFLAVLGAGSTLGAAQSLGIAQTTVARRIDTLEHSLGLTLFTRDTRGFHPTEAARALKDSATELETAANGFYRAAAKANDVSNQLIRVTTAQGEAAVMVGKIIAEFSETYPDARFQIINTQGVLDMSKGEADVAIRHGNRQAGDDVLCRKIFVTSWGIFCSRAYAARYGTPASPEALKDHRVLWFEDTFGEDGFKAWREANVPAAAIVTRCASVPEMLNAIAGGQGVGPVDEFGAAASTPPFVRCMAFPEETATWLLVSPEARNRPIVRAFADAIANRTRGLSTEYFLARQRPVG